MRHTSELGASLEQARHTATLIVQNDIIHGHAHVTLFPHMGSHSVPPSVKCRVYTSSSSKSLRLEVSGGAGKELEALLTTTQTTTAGRNAVGGHPEPGVPTTALVRAENKAKARPTNLRDAALCYHKHSVSRAVATSFVTWWFYHEAR